MKLKDGFIVREVGGKTFAVAVGERSREFNGMITLSGCAKFIWEKLGCDTDEKSIVDALTLEYEVNRETAEKDVRAFVSKLSEAGLLE